MRVLLDECLPRPLKSHLGDHSVLTVPDAGWSGLKNGELLARAEEEFDAFLTIDQGMEYEQALTGRNLLVIAIRAKSNRLADLLPLASQIVAALDAGKPGELRKLGAG